MKQKTLLILIAILAIVVLSTGSWLYAGYICGYCEPNGACDESKSEYCDPDFITDVESIYSGLENSECDPDMNGNPHCYEYEGFMDCYVNYWCTNYCANKEELGTSKRWLCNYD